MENDLKNTLNTYFGEYGLIFYSKLNEYYKVPLPNNESIKNIFDSLNINQENENYPNKLNYIACCLYLLSRKDESYKGVFCKNIISTLNIKTNPVNDIYLALIYNCIDFDENFLHSEPKNLYYLSKYLQKFSEYNKEESISLLYKYYNSILLYRTGKIEDALNECNGIIGKININNSDKIINFIKLKAQIFLAKIYEENLELGGVPKLQENSSLLKDIYDRTINENPFLALKIGFLIFHNSYNRNQYEECVQILEQMLNILKQYENQGVPQKKMSRFYLSIYCRFGIIGLILTNKNYISMAIEGMKAQLLLLQEGLKIKKIRQIFKAYTFSLNILKMNVGLYVEQPGKIGENFIKDDNFCINKEIKEQSIINYNAMNNNMNIEINETAIKLVDEYLSRINNPKNNFVSNDTLFTFVIGLYDKVRFNIEQFLKEKNQNNENKYKNQIVSLCETFWSFLNKYVEVLPLLRTNIFKTIIIKLFSSCSHIYFINKEFNKINQIMNYFDKLSNELNINENTPSYELALKVKGDLYFSQNDYNNSISYYKQSAKIMHDVNPKKAIVYFNLGVLYYYINDKLGAVENFQKAIAYFKRSEEEKYSFEVHKRNNVLTKKINLTNALIKRIQEN